MTTTLPQSMTRTRTWDELAAYEGTKKAGRPAVSDERKVFADMPEPQGMDVPEGPARLLLRSRSLVPPSADDLAAAGLRLVTMHTLNAVWAAHDWTSGMNALHETLDDLIDEYADDTGVLAAGMTERRMKTLASKRPSRVEVVWRRMATRHRIPFDDTTDAYTREVKACEKFLTALIGLPGHVAEQVAKALSSAA